MGAAVSVTSPSRLHLGIVDISGILGRFYGSIGVSLSKPNVRLTAKVADNITITMSKSVECGVIEVAKRVVSELVKRFGVGGVHIHIEKAIPCHVGLGSTTQVTLSVAAALRILYSIPTSMRELAVILGRGNVSGVGTAVFEGGGFVLDGGIRPGELMPPLIVRYNFPRDWIFIVAVPSVKRGLTEDDERHVFAELKGHPDYARRISHIVLMQMLPAIVERDIESFGEALTNIQQLVGESFSMYQKGTFHSEAVARIIEFMKSRGAYGVGQSSWGPACYGLVRGEQAALKLKEEVLSLLRDEGLGQLVFASRVKNRGAEIRCL